MKGVRKGSVMICGLAVALLAAGCSVKLPASAFPGFRLAPAEPKPGNGDANSPGQTKETLRQSDRAD